MALGQSERTNQGEVVGASQGFLVLIKRIPKAATGWRHHIKTYSTF